MRACCELLQHPTIKGAMQAPLRQLTSHMLPLVNPLDTPVTFTAAVNNAEVSVKPTVEVAPNAKVELPIEWWPDAWFVDGAARKQPRYERPHARLKRALYGHPEAGALWEKKLTAVMRNGPSYIERFGGGLTAQLRAQLLARRGRHLPARRVAVNAKGGAAECGGRGTPHRSAAAPFCGASGTRAARF